MLLFIVRFCFVRRNMSILQIFTFIIIFSGQLIDTEKMKIKDIEPDKEFFNNLQEIKDNLEEKEDSVEGQKASLEELKKEIMGMQKEIEGIQIVINDKIKSFSTVESDKVNLEVARLTRIFETMKSKNVAKIVEETDESLVIAVFTKLKEQKVGEIMKYLTPKKAAKLSELLTLWKQKYELAKKIKDITDTKKETENKK